MKKKISLLVAPLALGAFLVQVPPASAAPAPAGANQDQPQGKDLGATDTSTTISASIYFKIHNQDRLVQYITDSTTPGNPQYHKFLSVNQFVSQYAPSNGDIKQVVHYLQSFGLQVQKVYADNLDMTVTGTVDQFNNAFNTEIHDYSKNGKKFHAPKKTPKIPDVIANSVLAIAGLSTQQAANRLSTPATLPGQNAANPIVLPSTGSTATGQAGNYTVGDVANFYDVNPLYQNGVTGKGETIGIATLADFKPADAYKYWDAIGLKYVPNRITQVHVDGGGQFGADAGSGETSLDVEQSGGLAPNAKIVVYDGPNTNAGFLDIFYAAMSDNVVDTLSVSWGEPEIYYTAALNGGVDYTNQLSAFDQVYMEGAAQGISIFAAAGDSGAYDTERSLPAPYFSTPLSVDSPASDPYITAAGGTTLPGTLHLRHGDITIPTERAWGWDYLKPYLASYGSTYNPFSVGGGGGVSVLWAQPSYQQGVPGMNVSASGQSLIDYTQSPAYDYLDLPAGFAGRNAPDISMNADPETGYLLYSSADGGWLNFYGGTSFVAPQLNGITSLIDQNNGGRVGFLNPTVYGMLKNGGNPYGADMPFNDITAGDNWGYNAVAGYDDATGIGTPNAASLAEALSAKEPSKGKH